MTPVHTPFRLLPLALLAALWTAPPAHAQQDDNTPVRIGIANTAKIFNNMAETKDVKARMESARADLEQEDKRRAQDVDIKRAERDHIRSDNPQYVDKQKEYLQAAIELRAWRELQQDDLNRQRKTNMKKIFDEIEDAVKDVAVQKHLDLVIAETVPDLSTADMDQITLEQLITIINQRNVLYRSDRIDITQEVLNSLDSKFKSAATQP